MQKLKQNGIKIGILTDVAYGMDNVFSLEDISVLSDAKKLHIKTGIPLYHLDMIWHKSDKTHISREEFDETLIRIFVEEAWIMDGDFSRTMEIRMQACDTVILFDVPYEICMQGIIEREGTKRDDMPWETA